ncbi:PD40 domain-containing protein, partial [bacterium]|nr:PD40 domain-containing protein [bacterium]
MNYSKLVITLGIMGSVLFPAFSAFAEPAPEVERRVQGHLIMEGVPESVPADISERLEQYSNVRAAVVSGWDPASNGMLIFTRLGQTTQLYRVASPGSYREQLTFFNEPVNNIVVNPDRSKNQAILLKDVGGNESYQLYSFDFSNGRSKLLTNGKARYGSVVWNSEGTKIAYQSTQRNGSDWDIWIMDPQNPQEAKMVYSPGGYWCVMDWSADGSKLLVYKYVSITNSIMEVLDLNTGKTYPVGLRPGEKKAPVFALGEEARFTPDGKCVLFTTDREGEFQSLAIQSISTGKIGYIAKDIQGDIVNLELSKDGNNLAFVSNEGGFNKVYICDLRKGSFKVRQIKTLPDGVVYGIKFSPEGLLAVSVGSGNLPCDTYTVDLNNGDKSTRWTYSEIGGLNPQTFAAPQLFNYPSFDREIPAFCYMPKG